MKVKKGESTPISEATFKVCCEGEQASPFFISLSLNRM